MYPSASIANNNIRLIGPFFYERVTLSEKSVNELFSFLHLLENTSSDFITFTFDSKVEISARYVFAGGHFS